MDKIKITAEQDGPNAVDDSNSRQIIVPMSANVPAVLVVTVPEIQPIPVQPEVSQDHQTNVSENDQSTQRSIMHKEPVCIQPEYLHIDHLELGINEEPMCIQPETPHNDKAGKALLQGLGLPDYEVKQSIMVNTMDEVQKYKCSRCEIHLPDENTLQCHLKCKHQLKSFDCPICSQIFVERKLLDKHTERHEMMIHKCLDCGWAYDNEQSLDVHKTACRGKEKRTESFDKPAARNSNMNNLHNDELELGTNDEPI